MSSVVEQIKERLGIVDVVSSYLKLEKSGINLKAVCPFHNEKTASFFVSPDRGTFYCFGCGAKGDIFSFVEQFEGVDFKEALKLLAEKAGVKLSDYQATDNKEKNRLLMILETATLFFERGLMGGGVGGGMPDSGTGSSSELSPKKYLLDRGLSEKAIRDWRIGYVGSEWRTLYNYLIGEGYTANELLAVGLVKKTDSGTSDPYYDTFRSRIIFPIWDAGGKIVGFSGRIFPQDDNAPKYLNSPETALFKKSEILYGFDRAKTAIRKKDYSIVVEGQMDLIMSQEAGFINTVATSGTALSEGHLKRLMKISTNVMFAYDGDGAGIAAARRSAELALGLGMEVKIAPLPSGEDPASLIKKDKTKFAAALKGAKHIIDFYTDAIIASITDGRARVGKIREDVFPLLFFIKSSVDRSYFVRRIAEKIGVKEEALWEDIKKAEKAEKGVGSGGGGVLRSGGQRADVERAETWGAALKNNSEPLSRKRSIERSILGIIYWQGSLPEPAHSPPELRKRLLAVIPETEVEKIEKDLERDKEAIIFEVENYLNGSGNANLIIDNLFKDLESENLKKEFAKTMADLRKAEITKDMSEVEKLLKKCNEISGRLRGMENMGG